MPKNTKNDLLETIKPGADDLICPACGSPVTLQNKATFDVILSVNARKVINEILRTYRSLLQRNESELKTRNLHGFERRFPPDSYPYPTWKNVDEAGLYTGEGSKSVAEFLLAPDLQGISRQIAQLPTVADLDALIKAGGEANGSAAGSRTDEPAVERPTPGLKAKPDILFDRVIKTLISGFEPHTIIGPILNMVFEQEDLRKWIEDIRLENILQQQQEDSPAGKVLKLVQKISPTYYDYLVLILKAVALTEQGDSRYIPKKYSDSLSAIKDHVIRCVYTLAIFRGHEKYEKAAVPFVSRDIPYDLPRQVVISPPRLGELLRAKVVVDRKGFGWSEKFHSLLSENANDGPAGDMPPASTMEELESHLAELIERYEFLQNDLKQFVDFACRGLPGSLPQLEGEPPPEPKLACGWYPKEEPTHPIILIGSTGTSKSSVMMSGLTTFFAASSSVGVSVRSNSADDVSLLNAYQSQYYQGQMPRANETNTRYSVQLTTVDAKRPQGRQNFIFTDVPGEMVARSLEKTDTDPVILNLLKYAEIIVFFFDLATEPIFFNAINFGQVKDQWEDLTTHVDSLRAAGRGKTNQLLLLGKLIEDLRQIRGADDIKNRVSLICVIPKADFFAGDKSEGVRFLSPFYEELWRKKILDTSQLNESSDASDFSELRSMAAVSFDGEGRSQDDEEADPDLLASQIEVVKLINRQAEAAFRRVGDALGEAASATDKTTLEQAIGVGLLSVLKSTFKNVFLLPVSAQGKPVPPENGAVRLGHPPSQKLAEYVFIIPTLLALKEGHPDWYDHSDLV